MIYFKYFSEFLSGIFEEYKKSNQYNFTNFIFFHNLKLIPNISSTFHYKIKFLDFSVFSGFLEKLATLIWLSQPKFGKIDQNLVKLTELFI